MNIQEFYDSDERRRSSPEVELGTEWHNGDGHRYEVSWVQDTGELYVMAEPRADVSADIFGDEFIRGGPVDEELVQVVAKIDRLDQVEQVLQGWQQAMAGPDSITWLAEKVIAAGVALRQGEPSS